MLTEIRTTHLKPESARYAIVAARYNPEYTDSLVRFAVRELEKSNPAQITVVRVPGSFEVPVAAAKCAKASPGYDAILCFGAIFVGETKHADHIGMAVTQALADLQTSSLVPIIHGVLTFTSQEQARVRCLEEKHNRGIEAAHTAIEMAAVMHGLDDSSKAA